jgi:hypothetical protein
MGARTSLESPQWRLLLSVVFVLAVVAAACSDSDSGSADTSGAPDSTAPLVERPVGPTAELSAMSAEGNGVFMGSPDAFDNEGNYLVEIDDPAYVQEEFVAAGVATSYAPVGELTSDGVWTVEDDETADYRTRVLVRRPADADDFSGVVVVEWLNVSGGVDADPDWTSLGDEILRQGHAWVGVSAQLIGIEGGPVRVRVDVPGSEYAGAGLRTIDPERYGSLHHPGDAFSYDIYSQVARSLREGVSLGGLEPSTIIAVGESQSAGALVTYINGVQPTTRAFDAFFVHSRGASGLGFPTRGESVDIASSLGQTPTILRTDTDVPIVEVQAENDVVGALNSIRARQPDNDLFRLWEVAGTSHADLHLAGELAASSADCGVPINDGPFHVVAKAALRHLVTWVLEGEPPPEAPRIEVTEGESPAIVRNEDGIALGGVRTPPLDVPIEVLSGERGPGPSPICILSGSTRPLPEDRLAELYSSRAEYERQYAAAVDEAIDAGYVLEDDRVAIEGYADASLIPG